MQVFLYGRQGCHLCEVARQEFQPLVDAGLVQLQHRDIDGNADWHRAYAERIPVAQTEDGAEYSWPFRAAEVIAGGQGG